MDQLNIDLVAAKICGLNPTIVEETDRTPTWVGVQSSIGYDNRVLSPFELQDPSNILLIMEYMMENHNIAFGKLTDGKYTALDIFEGRTVEVAETLYDLISKMCLNLNQDGGSYDC